MRALLVGLMLLVSGAAQAQIGLGGVGRMNVQPLLYQTLTSTLVISGQSNKVYQYLNISTTSGDCIDISGSTNITIKRSKIGPCGTNNSTANSRGIDLNGNNGITIEDSYIHVTNQSSSCSDSHDGIFFDNDNGTTNIKGNILYQNETHIEGFDASNVTVDGNSFINTLGSAACSQPNNLQGHGVQFWRAALSGISNITITNNYLLDDSSGVTYPASPASAQSDGLSCGHVTTCTENGNYVVFDPVNGTVNIAACGIISESGTTVNMNNNIIGQTFHGGPCMSNVIGGTMTGNKVLIKAPTDSSAAGLELEADTTAQCGNISATNNTAYTIQSGGGLQSLFVSSKCTTNITSTPNTLDAAALSALDPLSTTNPPPLIPPVPVECVAPSPWATQTSKGPC